MAAIKITAGEIVATWKGDGPCDIVCRLCGNRVIDDAAPTVWNGYVGLGQSPGIDEHEQCDALEKALRPRLTAFFDSIGIKANQHARARDVLRQLLNRY
jgi:hypothetical protein